MNNIMNLTTLGFMLFCIITLLIYFTFSKKLQWVILLIASVIFIFWNNFSLFTVVQALIVLLSAYFCGRLIEKHSGTKTAKEYLTLGIVIIIGQLFLLKYSNLFVTSMNFILKCFGFNNFFHLFHFNSLLGISYYSLIMISYLVDIYRGACKSQKNIFKCALFMSYFPILTSGPFIRYNNIENDLYGGHKFDYKKFCYGILRILWGMFKILVISQRLGYFVDTVYGNLEMFKGLFTIIAMLFFPIQLYTNFSGSIDIIMGVSEMLGINLPENFNLPFFSKTITEFWRRWHITLGAWLKDYIFYPLLKSDRMQNLNKKCKKKFGKNVGKKIPLYLSMLVMWIVIGIWHGGAYTFIIGSGILQFIYIFLEDILEPIPNKLKVNKNSSGYKIYQTIRTYILFSFAMIFFRATSVANAIEIIKNIFRWKPLFSCKLMFFSAGLRKEEFFILVISLIILFAAELIARKGSLREMLFKKNILIRWIFIYSLFFFIVIFGCYGVGYNPIDFIYRQF